MFWRFNAERGKEAQQGQQQRQRRGNSPAVEVAVASARPIEQRLELVGNAEAPYNVRLAPRVSGRIDFLQVREGDRVTPGQVLVRIDPGEIEGQVLQQQASVSEARSRLAQARLTAGATDVGITSQIRQQQAAVESAQAEAQQTQRNLSSQIAAAQAAVTDANARIEAAEAGLRNSRAQVEAARANLRNAQTRYNRTFNLYKQGFIAAQDVDDARTAVEVEEGDLRVAQGQVSAAESAIQSARAQRASAANQVLITRRTGQAQIAAARARVTQARAQLSVAAANRSQGPAYRENLAALQAGVEAAEAQLRQAGSRRADTVLRSPIEGTVTERTADPGTLASPSQPVLTVQYLKWLYVTTTVPIDQSRKVVQGQPITIQFDAFPGRTFTGRVSQVNRAADPQSRQFTIRIRLENPNEEIRPGMFARVGIVTERVVPPVVVPLEAVRTTPRGTTVTVLDAENKATTKPVTLGARDAKFVAVTSGVNPGERVVTLSYSPVRDGQTVRIGRPEEEGEGGPGGGRGGAGGRGRGEGGGRGAAGGQEGGRAQGGRSAPTGAQ